MPASHVNDSKHWRDRAAEMRALSDMMKEPETIAIMEPISSVSAARLTPSSGRGRTNSASRQRPF